jgi:hypothetical protein
LEYCRECAPGQVQNMSGTIACNSCSTGQYQAQIAQTACIKHQTCAPGMHVSERPSATKDRTCSRCAPMHFTDETNAPQCKRCPGGKFQESKGQPFCETCAEGFTCQTSDRTGLVEKQECPAGMSCSGTAIEPCVNQFSDTATGKCRSCEDKQFVNALENRCDDCPQNALDAGDILDGVQCGGGKVLVKDGYFVVGSGFGDVPLDNSLQVIKCRDPSACNSTVAVRGGVMTVRTTCLKNTVGVLCGVCAPTHGFVGQTCLKCSKDNSLAKGLMGVAGVVFMILYWKCVRDALKHARRSARSKFVTMTTLKILMTVSARCPAARPCCCCEHPVRRRAHATPPHTRTQFLYKTSLLSNYQLDWGASMRYIFSGSSAASSGDPTSVVLSNCLGMDLHGTIVTKVHLAVPPADTCALPPPPSPRLCPITPRSQDEADLCSPFCSPAPTTAPDHICKASQKSQALGSTHLARVLQRRSHCVVACAPCHPPREHNGVAHTTGR